MKGLEDRSLSTALNLKENNENEIVSKPQIRGTEK